MRSTRAEGERSEPTPPNVTTVAAWKAESARSAASAPTGPRQRTAGCGAQRPRNRGANSRSEFEASAAANPPNKVRWLLLTACFSRPLHFGQQQLSGPGEARAICKQNPSPTRGEGFVVRARLREYRRRASGPCGYAPCVLLPWRAYQPPVLRPTRLRRAGRTGSLPAWALP